MPSTAMYSIKSSSSINQYCNADSRSKLHASEFALLNIHDYYNIAFSSKLIPFHVAKLLIRSLANDALICSGWPITAQYEFAQPIKSEAGKYIILHAVR